MFQPFLFLHLIELYTTYITSMSQFVHPNDALRLKLSAFSSSSILSPSPAAAPLRESWGKHHQIFNRNGRLLEQSTLQ